MEITLHMFPYDEPRGGVLGNASISTPSIALLRGFVAEGRNGIFPNFANANRGGNGRYYNNVTLNPVVRQAVRDMIQKYWGRRQTITFTIETKATVVETNDKAEEVVQHAEQALTSEDAGHSNTETEDSEVEASNDLPF